MHLKLPENYKLSERLSCASESDIEKILSIGEFVYYEGYQCANKDLFEKKYEFLKSNLEKEHLHKLHIESSRCDGLVQNNESLQKNIYSMKEMYKTQIEQYSNQISILQDKLSSLSSDSQNIILSKMESLLGYGNSIDNIEKGNYGENYVNNHIIEQFPDSNIDDVSASTASGDLIWSMETNDFKCLVEVKNVAHAKNLNIEKFERDVNVNSEKNVVNCGLFVSLKTDHIPYKGKLKLDFVRGIPVIYVANVFKNQHALTYAMYMIKEIQLYVSQNTEQEPQNESLEKMTVHFNKLKNDFINHQSIIEELEKSCSKTNIYLNKLIKNTDMIVKEHSYMLKQCNMKNHTSTNTLNKEQCIEIIIEYYKKHQKWPSGPESGISPHYRRVYKYSHLLTLSKERYETTVQDDNTMSS